MRPFTTDFIDFDYVDHDGKTEKDFPFLSSTTTMREFADGIAQGACQAGKEAYKAGWQEGWQAGKDVAEAMAAAAAKLAKAEAMVKEIQDRTCQHCTKTLMNQANLARHMQSCKKNGENSRSRRTPRRL